MNESKRIEILNKSRLSIETGNDISCVYFNNNMVLILLERNRNTKDCLFFRPNTYDYVIGKRTEFNGNFQCTWDAGSYGNLEQIIKEWNK